MPGFPRRRAPERYFAAGSRCVARPPPRMGRWHRRILRCPRDGGWHDRSDPARPRSAAGTEDPLCRRPAIQAMSDAERLLLYWWAPGVRFLHSAERIGARDRTRRVSRLRFWSREGRLSEATHPSRSARRSKASAISSSLGTRPTPASGAIMPETFSRSLAALLPDESVVVDKGVTFGRACFEGTNNAAPHDWLQLTGGASSRCRRTDRRSTRSRRCGPRGGSG